MRLPDGRVEYGIEFVEPVVIGVLQVRPSILSGLGEIGTVVHGHSVLQVGQRGGRGLPQQEHVVVQEVAPFEKQRQPATVDAELLATRFAEYGGGFEA